jgi:DNA polymerase (family 10)
MSKENNKIKFVEILKELAWLSHLADESPFKVKAYEKAAQEILLTDASLEDIANSKVKIKGIGSGIIRILNEYLSNKKIIELEEVQKKIPEGLTELIKIPGLGIKRARLLIEKLNIHSIAALEYACYENRLKTIPSFGEKLQSKILKSIQELKQNDIKIRLDQALVVFEEIKLKILELDKNSVFNKLGDILKLSPIVESIEFEVKTKLKEEEIKKIIPNNLGVPIIFYKKDKLSDEDELKQKLAEKYNIKEDKKFKNFEFSWFEPEWILKRKPTKTTFRLSHNLKVRGIFHIHTHFSDGANSLEEMVLEAQKLGFEYIGISDHSQSAFYANGLKLEQIKAQRKLIQDLQKKVSIKIFHGIESDILEDGSLDYPDDILKDFDFVIASIHSRFKMNYEQINKRIQKALENPWTSFWGHPTGRLLLARQGYEVDWDLQFNAIKKNNVILELNSNPHRLDVDWTLGEKIFNEKVFISINPDAHDISGLNDVNYGQMMAEKMMIEKEQIFNFKKVNDIEKFFYEKKQKALRS